MSQNSISPYGEKIQVAYNTIINVDNHEIHFSLLMYKGDYSGSETIWIDEDMEREFMKLLINKPGTISPRNWMVTPEHEFTQDLEKHGIKLDCYSIYRWRQSKTIHVSIKARSTHDIEDSLLDLSVETRPRSEFDV